MHKDRIYSWSDARKGDSIIRYNPQDNALIGARAIMRHLGIPKIQMLQNWIDEHHFPVAIRPDGKMISTMASIDEWIFITSAAGMGIGEHRYSHNASVWGYCIIRTHVLYLGWVWSYCNVSSFISFVSAPPR